MHSESVRLVFISYEKCLIQVAPYNVLLLGPSAVLHFDYPQINHSSRARFEQDGGWAGRQPSEQTLQNKK